MHTLGTRGHTLLATGSVVLTDLALATGEHDAVTTLCGEPASVAPAPTASQRLCLCWD